MRKNQEAAMRKPDIPRKQISKHFLNMGFYPHRPLETFGRKYSVLFLIYPIYSLDSPDS